jgi:hypothetical protein
MQDGFLLRIVPSTLHIEPGLHICVSSATDPGTSNYHTRDLEDYCGTLIFRKHLGAA